MAARRAASSDALVGGGFGFDALIDVKHHFSESLFMFDQHGIEQVHEAFGRGETDHHAPLDFDGLAQDPAVQVWIQGKVQNNFFGGHDAASKAPGFMREVFVHEGQAVPAGTILGTLQNPDLDSEKSLLEIEREALLVRHRATLTHPDANVRNGAPAIERMLKEIDEQLIGLNERLDDLVLRPPSSGMVRTQRTGELKGQFFQPGQPVFEIGHEGAYRVVIALNEQEARRVQPGQSVSVRFASLPGTEITGTVARHPVSGLEQFSTPILANMVGGDVPSEPDAQFGFRPSVAYYEAEMLTDNPPSMSRAGMLGKARITAGRSTLGLWTIDRIMDQIDPSIRM